MKLALTDQLPLRQLLDVERLRQYFDTLGGLLAVGASLADGDGTVLFDIEHPHPRPDQGDQIVARAVPLVASAGVAARVSPRRRRGEGPSDGRLREFVLPVVEPGQSEPVGRLRITTYGRPSVDTLRLLRLTAAAVGRVVGHERESRRRLAELTAVYNTSMLFAEARNLDNLLTRTVRLVADVMGAKAASIRLIDEERDELSVAAVWGLSDAYLSKGPLRLSKAGIDHVALEHGHEQVADLGDDPRVQFPDMPGREGIASMLSVAMRYGGQPVGVLRAYTADVHRFSAAEVELMKAVAAQAAAAIVNARLAEERAETEALERQVRLAADVQQRMLPARPPTSTAFTFATSYVPCHELAGDLYDFIELGEGRWGVVVADVAGKGVAASLVMATTRAFLRAGAAYGERPAEAVSRLNAMLCRDSKPGEFVSLFYGIFDAPTRTVEYTCAGHLPPLLLRGPAVRRLTTDDIVLGVLENPGFSSKTCHLRPGDRLLVYTDGLSEARDFQDNLYGESRVLDSLARDAADARELVQNVLWDMRRFVGLRQRSDDVTMVGVTVT